MFLPHPSKALKDLFASKPHQGIDPDKATFLFVGLDANYALDLAEKPIFDKVLEYHADGVGFWLKHKVHHPFLLHEYKGDGRFYHQSFAKMGFTPSQANLVSFTELLHIPTVGRSRLTEDDLDRMHLETLNHSILAGEATHVFLSGAVARLMRKSCLFPWLPRAPIGSSGPLGVWYKAGTKTVYSHLHFSVYGKFAERKALEALAMREILLKNS